MISMYDVSVPVFSERLRALVIVLTKAEANATERKIDPQVFLTARLAPDMLTFTKQVQIATDHAKGAAARLSGRELPSWPDDEKTFEDLKGRVKKALDYLSTFKPEDIDGTEDKDITLKRNGEDYTLRGEDYLLGRAQMNVWFHVTTAYNILRHNGVPLGKADFSR